MNSLSEIVGQHLPASVFVIGIGNPDRGDDGVGPYLAAGLAGGVPGVVVDGGEVPESYVGKVREAKATLVLLLDAMEAGLAPGSIVCVDAASLTSATPVSTHRVPLRLLAKYITSETGAQVFVLGIQKADSRYGSAMSPEVRRAADQLCAALRTMLGEGEVRVSASGAPAVGQRGTR